MRWAVLGAMASVSALLLALWLWRSDDRGTSLPEKREPRSAVELRSEGARREVEIIPGEEAVLVEAPTSKSNSAAPVPMYNAAGEAKESPKSAWATDSDSDVD